MRRDTAFLTEVRQDSLELTEVRQDSAELTEVRWNMLELTEVRRVRRGLDFRRTDRSDRDTVGDTWPLPVQPSLVWQQGQEGTLAVAPLDPLDPPSTPCRRPPEAATCMEAPFPPEHIQAVAAARTLARPEVMRLVFPLVSQDAVDPSSSSPVDRAASTLSARAPAKLAFPCTPSATVVDTVVRRPDSRGHR